MTFVWLLCFLSAAIDIYFVFYIWAGIVGLVMGCIRNLNDLKMMADGKLQPLQELKNLSKVVYAGNIPESWKKYVLPLNSASF